jgi:hypothetical protein
MKKHTLNIANKKYSEEELEDNVNLFDIDDWQYVSGFQVLSENFIEKYSDKVDWINVSYSQKLSQNFIRKHINKICINWLILNRNISKELRCKIINEINLLKEII